MLYGVATSDPTDPEHYADLSDQELVFALGAIRSTLSTRAEHIDDSTVEGTFWEFIYSSLAEEVDMCSQKLEIMVIMTDETRSLKERVQIVDKTIDADDKGLDVEEVLRDSGYL